ncbi:MAG: glycosyltransferase family 39 protein [Candidatus Liptonbacteria bacterium]|nr:glycosyltransferase family 39 protein [Candidatus Liptonbacteria bacterium]
MQQIFHSANLNRDIYAPKHEEGFWVKLVLAFIIILSGILMLSVARTDAGIMDELAHIPAGYGYVHNLDYRLNPEHPPLLKALSALPLLALQPNFPTDGPAWQTEINSQWDMGTKFLYKSGNDADQIIFYARLAPILLTLLTALLIFAIAKRLFGEKWALVPTLLFALSPSVLAHGHYVTTDMAAAFGILLSLYFFVDYLSLPSDKSLFWTGIVFGLAQSLKFSAVLLVPYFVLLALVYAGLMAYRDEITGFRNRLKIFFVLSLKKIWPLVMIFTIGYALVVYPLYFLFTRNYPRFRQTADTQFNLATFAGGPTEPGKTCKPLRCVAEGTILASTNELARPLAEYALGVLMVTQRSSGGNTAYFMNGISSSGSRSYFPAVFSLKETIPTLIFIFLALYLTIRAFIKNKKDKTKVWRERVIDYFGGNFVQIAFVLFVLFYWFMSVKSPLNIGFRHLIPTIPLIYILLTGVWKKWLAGGENFPKLAKTLFFAALLSWFALETIFAYPYFLSYFNEFGGGANGGYKYVTDSNYDWGQDLSRLRDWVRAHPEVDKIAVNYFGAGDPAYYLPGQAVGWWSSRGDPRNQGIHWLAVSVNALQDAVANPSPGFKRNENDEYRWLRALKPKPQGFGEVPKPDYRVGTSIFIYRLP